MILHTDGAKAYTMHIEWMLHDHVVHKKKRVVLNGVATWVAPTYTRTFKHKLPTGKTITVKGGTQVIDRAWRHLRSYLEERSAPVGSPVLRNRLRYGQWVYWNRTRDLWLKLGDVIQYN